MKLSETVLYKWYSPLPGWAKGAVVVGGMVGIYMAYRGISSLLAPPSNEQNALASATADAANFAKTQVASYPQSAYDGYAATCYAACQHGSSLDSATLHDTLELMKNNLDVAMLIKAYGIQPTTDWLGFRSTDYGLMSAATNCFNNDLGGIFFWRKGEVNSDWTSKGITYQIA